MKNAAELDSVLLNVKLAPCPHCRVTGALIGHGFLRGYAEQSSEQVIRGRRIFCSNRGLRAGCGRTFSVALAQMMFGFVVRTLTLWRLVRAVLGGLTRRAAWHEAGRAFSLSNVYRLWKRFTRTQSPLRVRLCREGSAPACVSPDSLAQLMAHLAAVVQGDDDSDLFAAFQVQVQCHLLSVSST